MLLNFIILGTALCAHSAVPVVPTEITTNFTAIGKTNAHVPIPKEPQIGTITYYLLSLVCTFADCEPGHTNEIVKIPLTIEEPKEVRNKADEQADEAQRKSEPRPTPHESEGKDQHQKDVKDPHQHHEKEETHHNHQFEVDVNPSPHEKVKEHLVSQTPETASAKQPEAHKIEVKESTAVYYSEPKHQSVDQRKNETNVQEQAISEEKQAEAHKPEEPFTENHSQESTIVEYSESEHQSKDEEENESNARKKAISEEKQPERYRPARQPLGIQINKSTVESHSQFEHQSEQKETIDDKEVAKEKVEKPGLQTRSGGIYSAREMIAWVLTFGVVAEDKKGNTFNAQVLNLIEEYESLAKYLKVTDHICLAHSRFVLRHLLLWMIDALQSGNVLLDQLQIEPIIDSERGVTLGITKKGLLDKIKIIAEKFLNILNSHKIKYSKTEDTRRKMLLGFRHHLEVKTICSYFIDVFGPYKNHVFEGFPEKYAGNTRPLSMGTQRHFLFNLVYLGRPQNPIRG